MKKPCAYPELAGLTGYRRGCRCNRCGAAKSRQKRRLADASRPASRRLILGFNAVDPAPLVALGRRKGVFFGGRRSRAEWVELMRERHGPVGPLIEQRLNRAEARGCLGEKHADEIAVALGTTPAEVYGAAWFALVCQDATEAELADIGVTHPALETA